MSTVQAVNTLESGIYTQNAGSDGNAGEGGFDRVLKENTGTETLEDIFRDVSEEYEVPLNLLKAVAQAESDFDTNAVSSCGAAGIMQLMPATAEGLGVEDVFDARQNITGGAKMLAYLLVDYDGDTTLALAAYNAGSGAVAKYGGVPPYEETRNYIKKINNILEGGLEADLSYISVSSSGSSKTEGADARQPAGIQGAKAPVRIGGSNDELEDIFSYDDYLKFIEIYMKLLKASMDEGETKETAQEGVKETAVWQELYELERARAGNRADLLIQNN